MFGFGARSIAFVDAAAASPFVQLSMIPLLTLIAYYAPPGHRATWFALMASLMNLALVAGAVADQVSQRHLRGRARPLRRARPAADLGGGAGFIIPVGAIVLFGKRAVTPRSS